MPAAVSPVVHTPSVSAIVVMTLLLVPLLSVFAVFIERHRRPMSAPTARTDAGHNYLT